MNYIFSIVLVAVITLSLSVAEAAGSRSSRGHAGRATESFPPSKYGAGADALVLSTFRYGSHRPGVVITYDPCYQRRHLCR
ncbi:MAG: hypothetical protein EOP04_02010 [Proteobacteria bacterium]|nr:MAG: hypothetical protein EOP04_02010 [Pseudomonadota bacterium]